MLPFALPEGRLKDISPVEHHPRLFVPVGMRGKYAEHITSLSYATKVAYYDAG